MIIDEKGRLFSKVSIVDILIVLFVVCAALFVGVKYFTPETAANVPVREEKTYVYTFKVNNIRQASVDAIEKSIGKDAVGPNGVIVGNLSEIVSVEDYRTAVTKQDGTMVMATVPDKFTLKGAIEVNATETPSGIMVGSVREVMLGSQMTITFPDIAIEILVTDIREK